MAVVPECARKRAEETGMIPAAEIKAKARQFSVPVSTIERDYAQGWLLSKLSVIDMSFKGGTALKKIFFGDTYRFSDDLDFTLLSGFSLEQMLAAVRSAVASAGSDSGIAFENTVEHEKSDSGYVIYTKFRIVNIAGPEIKIKLDISTHDTEILLGQHKKAGITHNYSDGLQVKIRAYSLDEIMAEKVRSCFQRTRPRDIYDIFHLDGKISVQTVDSMLEKKFKFKNIEPDLGGFIARKAIYESAWKNSIRHQVSHVPEFEQVFGSVLRALRGFGYIIGHNINKHGQ